MVKDSFKEEAMLENNHNWKLFFQYCSVENHKGWLSGRKSNDN